jgi:hypothetical protein
VFRSNKLKIANFPTDYAKHADFCDVFKNDTKSLYTLAFLLTANHKESEQCFVSTVDQAFKEQAVFKEWVRSWVRRRLIENAIEIVSPAAGRNGQKRDLWGGAQHETQRECEIDVVTKLEAFERFVFIMSVVERLSKRDCVLLLECTMKEVVRARMKAFRRLPELTALLPRGEGLRLRRREFTA